jgi:hypothetical protein
MPTNVKKQSAWIAWKEIHTTSAVYAWEPKILKMLVVPSYTVLPREMAFHEHAIVSKIPKARNEARWIGTKRSARWRRNPASS